MRKGTLHKNSEGWRVSYVDYQKRADGTAYGSPVEKSIELDPNQIELCESIPGVDGRQVSFDEVRLWKSPDAGWVKTPPAGQKRFTLPYADFAQIHLSESDKEQVQIEAKLIKALREFAWEVWKAAATADDQSRKSFDQFYTDLSGLQ